MYFSNLWSCFPILGLFELLQSCFLNSFDTSRGLAFYFNKLIQVNFVHFLLRPGIHYFSKESYFFLKKIEFRVQSGWMFSTLPPLYPGDVSSTSPPSFDNEICFQTLPKLPWRPISISFEHHYLRYKIYYFPFFTDAWLIFVCIDHSFFHQCLLGRHFGLSQIFAVKYSTGVNSLVLLPFYIFAN